MLESEDAGELGRKTVVTVKKPCFRLMLSGRLQFFEQHVSGLKYIGWSGTGTSSSPRAGPFIPSTNWVGSGALESIAGPNTWYPEDLVLSF